MSARLTLVSPDGQSRLKWEYEKERTSYDDLLALGTADMDFRTPDVILNALSKVLERGHLGYPKVRDEFYRAIENHLEKTAGWTIDGRSSIGQNVGIYVSVWNIIDAVTEPGDKITFFTPVHSCFRRMVSINSRIPIECPLLNSNGRYSVDYDALEACLSSGAKVLWLCNPHNPIGWAWTEEELKRIAELCMKHDVLILSDDVYCDLVFPGTRYTPIASLSKEVSYRTMTLYSTSKTFNTMGLKHSFVVIENPDLFKKYEESLSKLDLEYGLNTMGMAATVAAYTECDDWLAVLHSEIERKFILVKSYLEVNLPGCIVTPSNSTYFGWVDMRALKMNPRMLAYAIDQEEHIIVTSGTDLGKGGTGFVRLNLATSDSNLEKALGRLKNFWNKHYSN